jgi:hypothetical protein
VAAPSGPGVLRSDRPGRAQAGLALAAKPGAANGNLTEMADARAVPGPARLASRAASTCPLPAGPQEGIP